MLIRLALLVASMGSVVSLFSHSAFSAVEDRSLVQLYHYKPIYFLMGEPDTKVQVSFRAPVLKNYDLYFAYSQLMMWDFFKASRPFTDLNYNPEMFYRHTEGDLAVDVGFFEHESNGKDGQDSRSWDKSSIRVIKSFDLGRARSLEAQFKIWYARNFDETNNDILWYKGLFETQLTFSNILGEDFGTSDIIFRFFPGGKTHVNPIEGGRELTFRFRSRAQYSIFQGVVQIFEGHGESLLRYKDHVWGIRGGIGF